MTSLICFYDLRVLCLLPFILPVFPNWYLSCALFLSICFRWKPLLKSNKVMFLNAGLLFVWLRRARSQSCPFCRDSLKRVNSGDLWIYTSSCEIIELSAIAKENLKRLFMYIEKLPLLVPDAVLVSYDPQFRWKNSWGTVIVFIKLKLLYICTYAFV